MNKPEDDEIKTYNYQEPKPCGFMLNFANAVDNTNHEQTKRKWIGIGFFLESFNTFATTESGVQTPCRLKWSCGHYTDYTINFGVALLWYVYGKNLTQFA